MASWRAVDGSWASMMPSVIRRPGGKHGLAEHDPLPDLDDPATLGCIEHELLPKAWGIGCAIEVHMSGGADPWVRVVVFHTGCPDGQTFGARGRGEALVAALEAAP